LSLEFCWSLGLGLSLEFRCLFWSPLLFDELHAYEVDIYFSFFLFSFARLPLNSFLFLPGLFSQIMAAGYFYLPTLLFHRFFFH